MTRDSNSKAGKKTTEDIGIFAESEINEEKPSSEGAVSPEKPSVAGSNQPQDVILVAEDSGTALKLISHHLQQLGFGVIACEDGHDAWSKLKASPKGLIRAVISDLMMPKMDGLSFLKQVRNSVEHKDLAFLLLTSSLEKEYILLAKQLNVNGYILKPVSLKNIKSKLAEIFPDKVNVA